MIKVYEIDGTFLGYVDANTGSIYNSSGSRIGYISEDSSGGRWRYRVSDSTGGYVGSISQRIERLSNGKPGVETTYGHGSQTWMLFDNSGDIWKGVGHSLESMPVQKIGYLRESNGRPVSLGRETLEKAAAAAFLLVRHFYLRFNLGRDPLWFDADPQYFRCKPGTCQRCDYLHRTDPRWVSNHMIP